MTAAGYKAYKKVLVSGTEEDKGKLLLRLFNGALTSACFARRGIEEKSPKMRGESISRILAILTELDCALDREAGGSLAENLSGLYAYMTQRLTVANIRNDISALEEVKTLLTELKEGFENAVAATHKPMASNREADPAGRRMSFAV